MSFAKQSQVGLLTDIHYDGCAKALNRLYEAVVALNTGGVDTLILMGDLVNGTSAQHAKRLLREVAAICDTFKGQSYFMHGNHDLDYISKADFYNAVGRAGDQSCFDFKVGGYTVICLDANFSPNGVPYESGNFEWQQAYVPEPEIDWLRGRMAASMQPVVILSHQRLDKECTHAVQNFEQVREVVSSSDKVHAVFQGHNHEDDLQKFESVSYYTLAAHTDEAGPAVIQLDSKGVRLLRDFEPEKLQD